MGLNKFMQKMLIAKELEMREGYFAMHGVRGLIMPTEGLLTLVEQAYDEVGEDVFDMLFRMGRFHGEKVVGFAGERYEMPKRKILERTLGSANVLGLGRLDIDYFNPEKQRVSMTLERSPFVEYVRRSDRMEGVEVPVDQFFRGALHSLCEAIFDAEVVSEEQQCSLHGAPRCRFRVWVAD